MHSTSHSELRRLVAAGEVINRTKYPDLLKIVTSRGNSLVSELHFHSLDFEISRIFY